MTTTRMKIFAGNASRDLATEVCERLSLGLGEATVERFNDGEVRIQLKDDVREADVFIINSTPPPAEHFIELALLADAARGASASRRTLVIPYLGYNRGDKKDAPRLPMSAYVMMAFLRQQHAHRVLLFDLHSEATMSSFIPMVVDHLYASKVSVPYISSLLGKRPFVVASPDKGGGARAEKYASFLKQDDFVICYKSRPSPGEVREDGIKIVGNVDGKDVLFVDDIIDTAGTIVASTKAVLAAGAKAIYVFATHALFSRDALERINASQITEVVVTNTIYHDPKLLKERCPKVTVLSIASLLAEAIRRLHEGQSVSSLILS